MTRRLAIFTMLLTAGLTVSCFPAQAAPAGVEGKAYPRNLTLPANGSTVEEVLPVLLFADAAGWADSVTLTIDTSKVSVAEVRLADAGYEANCSVGPVATCVLPGPHRVFERPRAAGGYSFTTMALVSMSLTPKRGASIGDTGTLSIATKVDDQPATTETATIRIGEAVNLTAVDDKPQTVPPGGAVALRPKVRNTGTTAVDGLIAVINADSSVLADTNFGNCTYGYSIACTFDTTLPAGSTFGVSAPFTLRMPGDTAAASRTAASMQWLTAAEWQDQLGDYGSQDRAGTGPELTLEEVAQPAAGAPQADTDHDDNGSYTTVTVSGRRTDVVAIGATVPGEGGEQTISVGLVNEGPGTLRYPPFNNNAGNVRVSLPAPMSVITADDRCRSPYEDWDPPPSSAPDEPGNSRPLEFSCTLMPTALRPGERLMFDFTVRTAPTVHDEQGSVEVDLYNDGVDIDRDRRNNQAPIKLTGTGRTPELPITGTIAASVTAAGILLVLIGAAVVGLMRRHSLRE